MAQITTGLHSILSSPHIYDFLQSLLGAKRIRKILVQEYLKPQPGQSLLDIGCGTAQILPYLPNTVQYVGIDLSESYIEAARVTYGQRGKFYAGDITHIAPENLGKFHLVLAMGLLHHLNDKDARIMLKIAHDALVEGGHLITFDGCFDSSQSALARFIIESDRGRNVRNTAEYVALIESIFNNVEATVRHDILRVPYTHAIIKGQK